MEGEITNTGDEGSQLPLPEGETGAAPEGQAGVGEGAGSAKGEASTPTPQQIEDFEKIDPRKLNPEQLKIYKHFQGVYTKARQKDTASLKEYETNLKSYQELMNDPEIYARAHLLVYGKLPEGYVAPAGSAPVPGTPAAGVTTPTEEVFVDPAVKALRDEVKAMKAQQYQVEKMKVASEVTKFESDLFKNPNFEKLYKSNYGEIRKAAIAFNAQGYDTATSLKKAFNSIAADSLLEEGKKLAWEEVEKKAKEDRPEKGGGSKVVKTGGKGLAAAFAQAEAESGV